jgi:hypothetical protein
VKLSTTLTIRSRCALAAHIAGEVDGPFLIGCGEHGARPQHAAEQSMDWS